jgi:hypothetical protein
MSMRAGVWNLVIGLLAVVAGASGRFALIGTHSSTALVVIGGCIAALGLYQLVKSRKTQ